MSTLKEKTAKERPREGVKAGFLLLPNMETS